QAPAIELQQIVQQELNVNPVLEVETPEVSLEQAAPEEPDDIKALTKLDEEWREYYAQQRSQAAPRTSDDDERHRFVLDSIVAQTTLQEHLLSQLNLADIKDKELLDNCEFIIGNIDDDGFLHTKLDDLSLRHGLPIDGLQKAKAIVQSFDPAGVAAEDLRD